MPATGAKIELELAGAWSDITTSVYLRDRITIVRGRQDEGARVDPGTCTLTLNNKQGKFSPRNPLSPLYGLIGRNTPIRVSVAAGSPFLGLPPSGTDVRATTPSTTALNIAGDLDVRFDMEPENWIDGSAVVELGGKWGAVGQRSWRCYLFAGFLTLGWTTDGTMETQAAAYLGDSALSPRAVVRATLDVNNTGGGHTVRFYVGASMAGPWTQVGTDQISAGTAPVFASTAPVELGDVSSTGTSHAPARLYAVQIRAGIDGTLVAAPDFTAQAVGGLAFADSASVPWTINRASGLTNRRVRFLGEISAWPKRWDISGGDSYVTVQASGIRRRLGQGAAPLRSTLRRRIPADPAVVAYWPMEDGRGANRAYSPIPGVRSMSVSGLDFASDDSLAGSAALPVLTDLSSMLAPVPPSMPAGSWRVELVYKIDSPPAGDANAQFIIVNAGGSTWRIGIGATLLHLDVVGSDGTGLLASSIVPDWFFGTWNRFFLTATQSGGSVAYTIGWVTVGEGTTQLSDTFVGTASRVTSVTASHGPLLSGMALGHLAVFSAVASSAFDSADTGFHGEAAAARLVRLGTEEGIPIRMPYGTGGTQPMGPQSVDTALNLMDEAADADLGILYEDRDGVALAWRPRVSLYNQEAALALDYTVKGEVAPPLEPDADDQAVQNDITLSRPNGSSAAAVLDEGPLSVQPPPAGVGHYTVSRSVNVQSDDQLPDIAGWLLHLGTVDEDRFPSIMVNLAAGPWLVDQATAVDSGDLITIDNPPVWLGPDQIRAIAEGYSEVIGLFDWTIAYNCTPGSPWSVAVLEDPVLGRLDTAGSSLLTAVDEDDTVFPVANVGAGWVTDPVQFPFDLTIGGEQVTAVQCLPDVVDTFGRTVSAGWGSTDTGQPWTISGGSAADFSVSSGRGRHLLSSLNVSRRSNVPQLVPDFDLFVTVSTTALATGASIVAALMARQVDANNVLMGMLEFTTAGGIVVSIRRRLASVETVLNSAVTGLTHVANSGYRLRFQGEGTALRARAWPALGAEPTMWQAVTTDTSFTAAGQSGVRTVANTGNTNVSASVMFDDFASAESQRLIVARSVNGIVKGHPVAEDIRLTTPMVLAL